MLTICCQELQRIAPVLLLLACAPVYGQKYSLVVPGSTVASTATVTRDALYVVDQTGTTTVYRRQAELDSLDGRWQAFLSQATNQVLRWPTDHRGPMQIGQATAGGWVYRPSQMVIQSTGDANVLSPPNIGGTQPLGRPVNRPQAILPGNPLGGPVPGGVGGAIPGNGTLAANALGFYQLTTVDAEVGGLVLDTFGTAVASMQPLRNRDSQAWRIVPAYGDVVRIQGLQGNTAEALLTLGPTGPLAMAPFDQSPSQFWRMQSAWGNPNVVFLESVAFPGRALAGGRDGLVSVERLSGSDAQQWVVSTYAAPVANFPTLTMVSRDFRPVTELPAAQVNLFNSSRRDIIVLLADRRPGKGVRELKIPAGHSETVLLDRDAGGRIVEVYETRTPFGAVDRQEFVTTIPATSYYDVSVYEVSLKSIAIDRTGKSPHVIEDINYQPRSLGWFLLPPGTELNSGTMDVVRIAASQGNPGSVRPLQARRETNDSDRPDILERILGELVPQAKP